MNSFPDNIEFFEPRYNSAEQIAIRAATVRQSIVCQIAQSDKTHREIYVIATTDGLPHFDDVVNLISKELRDRFSEVHSTSSMTPTDPNTVWTKVGKNGSSNRCMKLTRKDPPSLLGSAAASASAGSGGVRGGGGSKK